MGSLGHSSHNTKAGLTPALQNAAHNFWWIFLLLVLVWIRAFAFENAEDKAVSLLNDTQITRFTNGRLLLNHQIQEGDLWIASGKIIPPQDREDILIDVQGQILAPGFIDLQINGAFRCDFSRNPEDIDLAAKQLLQFGVTAFLPTVISSSPEQYRFLLPKLQPRTFGKEGAAILGIHLEGPYFSSACAGAHNPHSLVPQFEDSTEAVYGDLQGVRMVTLAPEIPGCIELIERLKQKRIVISAGHSSATYTQIRAAIEAGVGCATHLFNAMAPYHHRNPGIIGAALIDPLLPFSLIVDNVHLCAETVRLCWHCNPNGLFLITDATEALGLPEGNYRLGTQDIEVHGDHITISGTRIIAGSNLNLNKAVRNFYSITQCSKEEALEAASLKPAKIINAYPAKGTLDIGADADFVVVSDELEVQATYIGGELAWKRDEQ